MNRAQREFVEKILNFKDKSNLSIDAIESGYHAALKNLRLASKTYTSSDGITLFRVVVYDERPNESKYFRSRHPADVIGYQRCNIPGSSMLYCCDSYETGIAEVSPKVGDVIYLCEFQVKNPITLVDMTQNISNDKGFFNSFREAFREPCGQSTSSNYKVTALLSQKLIQSEIKSLRRNIDGIMYPSVKQGSGCCLAVSHESELVNLKLTSVSELKFNGRDVEPLRTGRSIGIADNVYWDGE